MEEIKTDVSVAKISKNELGLEMNLLKFEENLNYLKNSPNVQLSAKIINKKNA